jgi:V/A-type H+-transporting ATPase subunit D
MPEEILETAKPTRMELLALRKKKLLAEKGHKLLTEKRDALISIFFDIIKQRNKVRKDLNLLINDAFSSLIDTEMIMGQDRVENMSYAIPDIGELQTGTANIMGVRVPLISSKIEKQKQSYSYVETNAKFDEATEKFRNVLCKVLKLAEVEGSVERLGVEIEKTKRRVNALEHIFIPRMKATVKYIEMSLQEREREDFFRRKRIKAVIQK